MKISVCLFLTVLAVFFSVSCKTPSAPAVDSSSTSETVAPTVEVEKPSAKPMPATVPVLKGDTQNASGKQAQNEPNAARRTVKTINIKPKAPIVASEVQPSESAKNTEGEEKTVKDTDIPVVKIVKSVSADLKKTVGKNCTQTQKIDSAEIAANMSADADKPPLSVHRTKVEEKIDQGLEPQRQVVKTVENEQSSLSEQRVLPTTGSSAGQSNDAPVEQRMHTEAVKESEVAHEATPGSFFSEPEVVLETGVVAAAQAEPEVEKPVEILPRRFVRAKISQFIDIPYPGKNWIFLGETQASNPPVVRFVRRVFSKNDTVFSLQAKSPGKSILHFCKQDMIENTYIDDYVAIEVANEVLTANERVQAAESSVSEDPFVSLYENALVPDSEVASNEKGQTDFGSDEPLDGGGQTPDEIYAAALTAFNEKRYSDSLTLLDEYEASAATEQDMALFLRSRIYESDSDLRNIRAALASYEKITSRFPESSFWDAANKRSVYIKRFYFDIR